MTQQYTAQYFFVNNTLTGTTSGMGTALLVDSDLVRGNASGELVTSPNGGTLFDGYTRFIFPDIVFNPLQVIRQPTDGEVTTTVTFRDGTTLSGVRGLQDVQTGPYAETFTQYLLDATALASVGKTLVDVASVAVDAFVDHAASWADLGFASTGVTVPPPDPLNAINGSNRADVLVGTSAGDLISGLNGSDRLEGRDGNDVLQGGQGSDSLFGGNGNDILAGGDGNDRLTGGAGADTFVFGADARDGNRDRDIITDFDASRDRIVLEDGALIAFAEQRGSAVFIQLQGDGDTILVQNANVGIVANVVFTEDALLV